MTASNDNRQAMIRRIMRVFTPFHRQVLRLSRGRVGKGWSTTRQPLVLLTTIGRKSGEPRTAVVGYIEDGDALVVVASKGGLPEHPAWYLNILANPEVTVERDGGSAKMCARTTEPAERDRLWQVLTTRYPQYATYQAGVSRQIPVVMLEPID